MKALVKREARKGIWMEDAPLPDVGMNDVLIRILRTAICGTDLHIYLWNEWAARTIPVPMVIGHEFVGEIVEVGENVNDFHAGQIVSGEGHVVCGRCRNCMAGRRHLCAHTSGVGVNRPGAFAEYISLPMSNVWEHRDGIDLDIASIFDPFGNAVHTALQFDLLGEDVLITGAGPIGCMAAAVCKFAGARNVVITDISDYRLGLASSMGATRAVNITRESLADVQRDLDMGEGFDVAMEMSGAPSAFQDILNNLCHGGKVAVLGIPDKDYSIDWEKIIFNMITVRGV
ncbi:MAG: L-threonine 3-dehydrogenase, partial [Gammaproteobacteria bacterium]|nr:L-threonine 3-dehydrogenase [Gammaproteobacteria bacterium]